MNGSLLNEVYLERRRGIFRPVTRERFVQVTERTAKRKEARAQAIAEARARGRQRRSHPELPLDQ